MTPKPIFLLLALSLEAYAGKPIRGQELAEKNHAEYDEVKNQIEFVDEDGWETSFGCDEKGRRGPPNYLTTYGDPLEYVACCADKGSAISRSEKKLDEWHCCGSTPKHYVSDFVRPDGTTVYDCCPVGQNLTENGCKKICKNGKQLDANGECVCPENQVEDDDGVCHEKPDDGACSSGLVTGKCYMFKGVETQKMLSWAGGWQYSEASPHKYTVPGKFKLCRDETCRPGRPVNPSNLLYIQDLHGAVPTSNIENNEANKIPGQWLNNASGGSHIGKTQDFKEAGEFSITKWSCNTYCLTGLWKGVGMACPSEDPSLSFYADKSEACREFELIEVPCNIRSDDNNCMFPGGGPDAKRTCGRNECLAVRT